MGQMPHPPFPMLLRKLSSCPSGPPVILAPPSHTKSHSTADLLKSHTASTEAVLRASSALGVLGLGSAYLCALEPSGHLLSLQQNVKLQHTQFLWIPNFNLVLGKW